MKKCIYSVATFAFIFFPFQISFPYIFGIISFLLLCSLFFFLFLLLCFHYKIQYTNRKVHTDIVTYLKEAESNSVLFLLLLLFLLFLFLFCLLIFGVFFSKCYNSDFYSYCVDDTRIKIYFNDNFHEKETEKNIFQTKLIIYISKWSSSKQRINIATGLLSSPATFLSNKVSAISKFNVLHQAVPAILNTFN